MKNKQHTNKLNTYMDFTFNYSEGDIFTPVIGAEKVIGELYNNNKKLFESDSTTFGVPYCTRGIFLTMLEEKLLSHGHSIENIRSRVIGFDDRLKYVNHLTRRSYNIRKLDFLNGSIYMKFDCVIMNPPYKIHVDVFNKGFDYLKDNGTLICIHPSTPFVNRKNTKNYDNEKQIKNIVSDYDSRLTFVDGNKIFNDAGFFTPLSVTRVNKVKNKKIEVVYTWLDESQTEIKKYNSLDDIYIHGNDIVLGIRDKIFSKVQTKIWDKVSRRDSFGRYYVKINTICGNTPKKNKINPDFFCLIYKSDEYNKKSLVVPHESLPTKVGDKNYISVGSIEEGNNCFDYLLTKFSRFCLSLYKINSQLSRGELMSVPYMDFTQKWNDEKLFKYFEFNQDEINFINDYIEDWYEQDIK